MSIRKYKSHNADVDHSCRLNVGLHSMIQRARACMQCNMTPSIMHSIMQLVVWGRRGELLTRLHVHVARSASAGVCAAGFSIPIPVVFAAAGGLAWTCEHQVPPHSLHNVGIPSLEAWHMTHFVWSVHAIQQHPLCNMPCPGNLGENKSPYSNSAPSHCCLPMPSTGKCGAAARRPALAL